MHSKRLPSEVPAHNPKISRSAFNETMKKGFAEFWKLIKCPRSVVHEEVEEEKAQQQQFRWLESSVWFSNEMLQRNNMRVAPPVTFRNNSRSRLQNKFRIDDNRILSEYNQRKQFPVDTQIIPNSSKEITISRLLANQIEISGKVSKHSKNNNEERLQVKR
jgi:hypothetical protein